MSISSFLLRPRFGVRPVFRCSRTLPRSSPSCFDSSLKIRRSPAPFLSSSLRSTSTSSSSSLSPASSASPVVDFNDTKGAFSSKSTGEIFRAIVVLRISRIRMVVQRASGLLLFSKRVLGTRLTHLLLRKTFFGHFCGGETATSIGPTVEVLQRNGVGAILDYAAEGDVESNQSVDSGGLEVPNPSEVEGNRLGVISARVYEYEGEEKSEANMRIFLSCIETAAAYSRSPDVKPAFAAIKLTGLGNPDLLQHVSEVLHRIRRLFREMNTKNVDRNLPYVDRSLSRQEFVDALVAVGVKMSRDELGILFDVADTDKNGSVDYLEWIEFLHPTRSKTRAFFTGASGLELPLLSRSEIRQMENMYARLDRLAEVAAASNVTLMVDAEHTYFQPAIDQVVLDLQRRYNREKPVIFNTIQCYLKDSHSRLLLALSASQREGWHYGVKLVRGAYQVLERTRAVELGYKDPIQDSIQDTHNSYNRAAELMLNRIRSPGSRDQVMLATHNEDSIHRAIQKMQEFGIHPDGRSVFFGQLLGMCDHVSFSLGHAGYNVYKYVPYGPIDEVVPYLVRRAQENSDILGGSTKELALFESEFVRRLFPWKQ